MFKKNEPNQRTSADTKNTPKPQPNDPGFGRGRNNATSNSQNTPPQANSQSSQQAPSRPKHQGPRAVIGASVVIKGEVHGEEDVSIYGTVNGSIILNKNSLLVGESGKIDANVEARNVEIDGSFKGEIKASERITIRKTGNVNGNISAPRVMLEDGCRFEGSIAMADKVR